MRRRSPGIHRPQSAGILSEVSRRTRYDGRCRNSASRSSPLVGTPAKLSWTTAVDQISFFKAPYESYRACNFFFPLGRDISSRFYKLKQTAPDGRREIFSSNSSPMTPYQVVKGRTNPTTLLSAPVLNNKSSNEMICCN